jgi:glycosyltransferase involved in cell wall biosynthesis
VTIAAATDHRSAAATSALPTVSVITPTSLEPNRRNFLFQLHQDITAAAEGLDLEWVIVVDGDHQRSLPPEIAEDPRVTFVTTRRQVGAAGARNLGLAAASGRWIASVDDDDRLPVDSLKIRLAAAAAAPYVSWVGARLADLTSDGALKVWESPAVPGSYGAGDVWRSWEGPGSTFPIAPNTLIVRSDVLRAVGGWQGLPQADDYGMVIAVTGALPGVVLPETVYHYRQHRDQLTETPGFMSLEGTARDVVFERGRLLAG